jgi:hypothetical protein
MALVGFARGGFMAIRIAAVKSSKISDDQKEILLATTGKYTGDLELRFTRECLDDAIAALNHARSLLQPYASPGVPPSVAPPRDPKEASVGNPDEVRFEVPKNFTVTAETGRGLVLFILNHKLEGQRGYALAPDAAKKVADGLIKSAEAMLANRPPPTPTS